jgi:hypothetical protein
MLKIKIEGSPPYDGEHELDLKFTNRDLQTIMDMAHVEPVDIVSAMQKGNTSIFVALAVIALRREGQIVNPDALWDAEAGKITFLDDDAVPPPKQSSETEPKQSAPTNSSGDSGNGTGDTLLVADPSSTGTPA